MSCVYIFGRDVTQSAEPPVKIGISENPEQRQKTLQTGCPFKLILIAKFMMGELVDAKRAEDVIHHVLRQYHLHGEWFDVDPNFAIDAICTVLRFLIKNWPRNKQAYWLHTSGVLYAEEFFDCPRPEDFRLWQENKKLRQLSAEIGQ